MRTTLGRGSAYALTSVCVTSMVSYNLVRNTKRGFLYPQFVSDRRAGRYGGRPVTTADTERGQALSLRSETKRGHKGKNQNEERAKTRKPLSIVGTVIGIIILASVVWHVVPFGTDSREALEDQASKTVMELLTEHEVFSSFFTIQKTANCILVKADANKNTYSGSIDVYCKWKDGSQKDRMKNLFVAIADGGRGVNGAVLEEFVRQLGEEQKFKFDVEMVVDGSRYNVTCQGATRQENPAYEVVLTMLELRKNE